MSKLTEKQKLFCKEYLVDLNATQAAIRAEYSEKTAGVIGHENLKKPYIEEYIQELMTKRADKVHITAEDVLKDILDTRDTLKDVMVQIDAEGVQSVDTSAVNGRIKANELLGKHLKLFTDKQEVEHSGDLKINFNIPRPNKDT